MNDEVKGDEESDFSNAAQRHSEIVAEGTRVVRLVAGFVACLIIVLCGTAIAFGWQILNALK